jgi:hypothetical protein
MLAGMGGAANMDVICGNRLPVDGGLLPTPSFKELGSGLPGPEGAWIPASFFGYRFVAGGITRAGMFAVPMNEEDSNTLQKRWSGDKIRVRYDPADPDTSFLVDLCDARFVGRKAIQGSGVLECPPEFHIADALEG